MNNDLLATGGFFFTVIVLALGIPLMRAWVRRRDRETAVPPSERERDAQLARIEHAIGAMAIEVERISEGQRFVTKLLAERGPSPMALPRPDAKS